MAEWSIAAVLKTVEVQASGGSNPSLSANGFEFEVARECDTLKPKLIRRDARAVEWGGLENR
jgi:hypothetical protein